MEMSEEAELYYLLIHTIEEALQNVETICTIALHRGREQGLSKITLSGPEKQQIREHFEYVHAHMNEPVPEGYPVYIMPPKYATILQKMVQAKIIARSN